MEVKPSNVLYLIGGPNGSGKTTLAEKVFGKNPQIAFLNPDIIAREQHLSEGNAGLVMLKELEQIFSTHDSFVYETTLSDKFHSKLIKRAKNMGYSIEFFYVILSSVEQNLARVQERFANGGHNVPESTVRRRHKKSLFNFDSVYKLSDHWQVYDNAGAACKLFATGIGDVINVVDNDLYNEFIKHKQQAVSEYMADIERHRAMRLNSANMLLSK
ncbi:MAG: zeta toxin family protein [Alphaproteobacteria bacterium]|nr:zeta toxin family protein [Alphaproteobacteria bacterium]